MSKRLKKLQAERAQLKTRLLAIVNAAETEDRDLTAEEQAEITAGQARLTSIGEQVTILEQQAAWERDEAPAVDNDPATDAATRANVKVGRDRAADKPWANFGEQLIAIAHAGMPGGKVDPRLLAEASGASAAVGADGGFLIQTEFSNQIYDKGIETAQLASRCDSIEIGANADGIEVPYIVEKSRATGSRFGGVRVYRRAEADTVASSKVQIGKWELRLEDLMGIAYMTERLLQDASAMQSVMSRAFVNEFAFVLDDEIFSSGTGAGNCLAILKSNALVKVAKEAAQAAGTVVAQNIMKIWARVPVRSRFRGVWLYNQELEPQLQQMTIGAGAGAIPVYLPPGGLSGQPYGTIYGRPAIPLEQASAPGEVGDIGFYDFGEYGLIRKGGLQADQSMHVRFLYAERAFRWIMRVNGQPKWDTAVQPYKGANTISPFVTLDARP